MSKYLDDGGLLYFWQKIKAKFVAQEKGKGLSTNDYTTEEKTKLSTLENYTLTPAETGKLGGIKVGAGLTVTKDGTLSASGGGVADSVNWEDVVGRPTNVSEFTNDAKYQTDTQVESTITGKGYQTASEVNSIVDGKGYQTQEQVQQAINTAVTSAVTYKGSKATLEELQAVKDAKVGDMYNVTADGMNYVWSGSEWDAQGATVSIEAIPNGDIDTIVSK